MKYLLLFCLIILLFTAVPEFVRGYFQGTGHPKEYAEFNNELNRIRNDGAARAFLAHRQAVQLMDLDSDGSDGDSFSRLEQHL